MLEIIIKMHKYGFREHFSWMLTHWHLLLSLVPYIFLGQTFHISDAHNRPSYFHLTNYDVL